MTDPRTAILSIQPYVPGRTADDLKSKDQQITPIKLSSNENPMGPSPLAIKAAQDEAATMHLYPDGASRHLKQAIADVHQVNADQVIMGCGSDEVIRMIAEAYVDPGAAVVFADVTFSQYSFVTKLMGGAERIVPLKDGVHDLDGFAKEVIESEATVCFICNPNNPTGTYVTKDQMERFLKAIPEKTLVVIDEAYYEYADADDFPNAVDLVRAGFNVIALRTFSKAYALSGLRVGYGIASPAVTGLLERIRPPFNVNRLAQAAALEALKDNDHLNQSVNTNRAERRRLIAALVDLGLKPLDSQANFLWVKLGCPATPVYEGLADQGVIVRDGTAFGVSEAIRVTIGTPDQNDRFLEVLRPLVQ